MLLQDYGFAGLVIVFVVKEGVIFVKWIINKKNGFNGNNGNGNGSYKDIKKNLEQSTEILREISEQHLLHSELSKQDAQRTENLLMKLLERKND